MRMLLLNLRLILKCIESKHYPKPMQIKLKQPHTIDILSQSMSI
jgi:hypothetical protein